MVLLSAQGMPVVKIAEVTFTSADRIRDVLHNFNADGFDSLYPKYKGGRPKTFTLPERREIKKIAKSKPAEHDLPFSTWSLAKLADFLVAEGVVDDISHEGLRVLLSQEGVSFQRLKTWKTSRDPNYAAKKARIEHLYAIADDEVIPEEGEPEVILCMDEFGPLNLQPHPGRQWAERGGRNKDLGREPRAVRLATRVKRRPASRRASCSVRTARKSSPSSTGSPARVWSRMSTASMRWSAASVARWASWRTRAYTARMSGLWYIGWALSVSTMVSAERARP